MIPATLRPDPAHAALANSKAIAQTADNVFSSADSPRSGLSGARISPILQGTRNNPPLKADLPVREPGELDVRGRDRLLAGKVNGSLPVLIGEAAVNLKFL
jgi:hypothetical protein